LLGVVLADEGGPLAGAEVRSVLVEGNERTPLPDAITDGLGRFRVDVSLAAGLGAAALEESYVECVVVLGGWAFDKDHVDLADPLFDLEDEEDSSLPQLSSLAGREFPTGEDFEDELDLVETGTRGGCFEGRVVDGTGAPVRGAMAWLEGRQSGGDLECLDSTVVDSAGRFVIQVDGGILSASTDLSLCAASAPIGEGCLALGQPDLWGLGPFDVRLEEAGVISGRLVSESGARVAGTQLWIEREEVEWRRPEEATELVVGEGGEFAFRGLPEGRWELFTYGEALGTFETGVVGIVLETGNHIVRIEARAPAGVPLGQAILEVWAVGEGAAGWRALQRAGYNEDRVRKQSPGVWNVEMWAGRDFAFDVTVGGGGDPGPHTWYGSGVVEWDAAHPLSRASVELQPQWESTFELVLLDPDGVRIEENGVGGRLLDSTSSALVALVDAGDREEVSSGTYRLELTAGDWLFGTREVASVDVLPGVANVHELRATKLGGRLGFELMPENPSHRHARYDVRLTPLGGGPPVSSLWSWSSGCVSGQSLNVSPGGVYTSTRAFEPGVWHCELVPLDDLEGDLVKFEFDVTFVAGERTFVRIDAR
jgi:hypothetical protein